MKCQSHFCFLLFIVLVAFKSNAQTRIHTANRYQSEFEWLDSSKMKFVFYTYRPPTLNSVFSKKLFPDSAFVSLFNSNINLIKDIKIYRDSAFIPNNIYCTNRKPCATNQSCNSGSSFTTFRYTGIVDFNKPQIKDTLDKYSVCNVDVVFVGNFFSNAYFNFEKLNTENHDYDSQYCYFSINRCYKWKKGDKSPKFIEFEPVSDIYRLFRKGTTQIDFGINKNSNDSVVYELTQPINFATKTFWPFAAGNSINYYINSYCRFSAPCPPRPELNPPQGFYLNPKTGISVHHNTTGYISGTNHDNFALGNNLYCVKIKTFKTNQNYQKILVSEQVRIVDYLTNRTSKDLINMSVFVENFPLRKYACANKSDTLTIRLRDTMAVNQTIPDTIAYQVYQNLPGGTYWESQTTPNNKEIKIAWNPVLGQTNDNPYLFNINANEQRCWPYREYEFRSCEFYVVQMPEFTIKKTLQNCGRLELKAQTNKPDENTYNYAWTLTHSNGTKLSTSFSDAALQLPLSGKWYISLKATNTPHGCSGTFLDSIELPIATPKVTITPKVRVCQGQTLTCNAQKAELELPLQYLWQIGNQSSSDSTLTLQAIDSFKVKLSITDNRGCTTTDSFEQKTFPLYVVKKLKDTAVCIGQSISVSATPNALQDSVLWLHNNSKTLIASLLTPQVYKVQYKNQNGCTAIDSFTLKNNDPIIPVKYRDETVCKGDTINLVFIESSLVQYQSVQWRENGVLQSNPNQFRKPIFQNTTLEISATGRQFNISCTEKDTIQIAVHPAFANQLQINKTDTCLKSNEIQANILGSSITQSQTIEWGDGFIITGPSVSGQTHQYSQAQVYNLVVRSITEHGCKDTQIQQIEIYPNPILQTQIKQASLCQNSSAELLLSSIPNSTQHRINWGDGNSQNNLFSGTYNHQYTQANSFNINIEATDGICKTDTSLSITINPLPQTVLTADNLCLGDSTIIKVQSNSNNQYTWLPQGTAANNNQTQVYKFPQTGTYEIKLQTTDLNLCQSRDSIQFSIIERPKADFTYANLSKELKYKFKFVNQSTNATGYEWFFTKTNTQTSTDISPEMVFTDTGIYTIILIADKNKQCFDTTEKQVPILEQMVFYFPNIVTLNNDGINETFGLSKEQNVFVIEYQMEVFNRWGELLFKTNDSNKDWQPNTTQQGVYIYQAKVRDIYNVLHELKGVVEVLR